MRRFAVVAPNGQTSAWLEYDESTATGTLKVNREADPKCMSPLIRILYSRGIDADARLTEVYIRERVCPPERENIWEILRRYGLYEYNPYLLSFALGGYAVCDRDHFEEIET